MHFFIILHISCFIFLIVAVFVLKKEYKEKLECGYKFVQGDIKLRVYDISMLIGIAWIGAFISAFCGIGGGMIFCPILIIFGIESQVATASGMYITLFTSLSSTIIVITQKDIYFEYAIYILAMTVIGTFIGLFFQ